MRPRLRFTILNFTGLYALVFAVPALVAWQAHGVTWLLLSLIATGADGAFLALERRLNAPAGSAACGAGTTARR